MKRDMNLIRGLLLAAENGDLDEFAKGRDQDEVVYHCRLLSEAGFIEGRPTAGNGFLFLKITWDGHDFLDSIRADNIWRETQEKLEKVGGSVALDTVKAVAAAVTVKLLGL